MGDKEFHRRKIEELLDVYQSSDKAFVKGVCLFYIGVHAVDLCLAEQNIHPSTHRGRRRAITDTMDEVVSSSFNDLLSDSLRIRYSELSEDVDLEQMKNNLKRLVERLKYIFGFPEDLAEDIFTL